MVTVEVSDSGEGIPPEHLGKLFTPFFSTKPVGKGTGLGLAIVYGIIKMHRGQINVRVRWARDNIHHPVAGHAFEWATVWRDEARQYVTEPSTNI